MEKIISIDRNKCIHCGSCIRDCAAFSLEFDMEKIPKYRTGGEARCMECQHCMAVCPSGAFSFGGKDPADSLKTGFCDSEALALLIKSRRSVRCYKNEDVKPELLDKIKAILPFSPTGCNADTLHFSIVESREKMEEIRRITAECLNKDTGDDASGIVGMCRRSIAEKRDLVYRGATAMIAAAVNVKKAVFGCENVDPLIALSYVELYAQSLGLGTLWCDLALEMARRYPEVRTMLAIPDGYTLNYIMMLGVPAIRYRRTIQPDPFSISEIK